MISSYRATSAHDLIRHVQPGMRVFVHGAAATPALLLEALANDHARLKGTEVMHLHTVGEATYASHREFKVTNLFVGENLRKRLDYSRIDYLPCFLSEIPQLFRSGVRRPDVALLQVSPPDSHGYCSLGTSVDVARAAVDSAAVVLAQVNPKMPRTHGDGVIPFSRITAFWDCLAELPSSPTKAPGPAEQSIAAHVAALVEDGSTLQIGIGAVPDAVLANLKGHRRLGIHTETFSDGVLPLVECGAIDNSLKLCHRGHIATSFVSGSQAIYRFVHDNPSVLFLESDYINDARNIARNPKAVAINSAVEVDLTGQVVADSVGHHVISGVGGQMDFIRGASLSTGGKAIIALPSRTRNGKSRIVSTLQPGAGVVTTRAHVHFIVTEHGTANLYGKTLAERAAEMIRISHPDDREELSRAWHDSHKQA
jgi:4-hydroxybutyrate CoA-transferase